MLLSFFNCLFCRCLCLLRSFSFSVQLIQTVQWKDTTFTSLWCPRNTLTQTSLSEIIKVTFNYILHFAAHLIILLYILYRPTPFYSVKLKGKPNVVSTVLPVATYNYLLFWHLCIQNIFAFYSQHLEADIVKIDVQSPLSL